MKFPPLPPDTDEWADQEARKTFDDEIIATWIGRGGRALTLVWVTAMIRRLTEIRQRIAEGDTDGHRK